MEISKSVILYVFFSFAFSMLFSQPARHIVYFSDKSGTPYSISDPSAFLSSRAIERRQKQNISINERDFPVNPDYLDSLSSTGAQVLFSSRWLNAAMVLADASQVTAINVFSFVKGTGTASKTSVHSYCEMESVQTPLLTQGDYGASFGQIRLTGTDQMHADGYTGKNKLIAVIDAGFKNADTLSVFDSLFIHNRIVSTYDFVDMESDVYDDHDHGTLVLSVLGGYLPGSLIGSAWQADYLLLRSEDSGSETLSEEFNFVRAAEYADSAGADLINCSLGYNHFDNSLHNHSYQEMDGNTTIITQAADIAASRGILVVVSAGNEGDDPWKKILAPADGDSVIAVAATNASGYYQAFSSKGPSYDGRIKPDLAAQGAGVTAGNSSGGLSTVNGTSLASPLITGLAAGIWQAFPELTNMELMYYLRKSASQYLYPDNLLGYGIPNYGKAKEMISRNDLENISIFPNPGDGSRYIINLPLSETGKEVNLQAFDITGRMIFEQAAIGTPRLEMYDVFTNVSPGMYFIQILGGEKKYHLKVIKE